MFFFSVHIFDDDEQIKTKTFFWRVTANQCVVFNEGNGGGCGGGVVDDDWNA